jgi:methionyl-tRNA formyltransferase
VKAAAQELGLSVYQPELASGPEAVATLRTVNAELGVVVAYGEILGSELLSVAEGGFINLHA